MTAPTSEDFHALLREMGELHDKKQQDYGAEGDPFANVRSAAQWGLAPSLGACIRIGDKVARLHAFYKRGELANESVEDAYMDLAVYAIIGLLLYREESAKEADDPIPPGGDAFAWAKRTPAVELFDQDATPALPTDDEILERAEANHARRCSCDGRFTFRLGPWVDAARVELFAERGIA